MAEGRDSCASCYHVSDCTLLQRRRTIIIIIHRFSKSVYLSLFPVLVLLWPFLTPSLCLILFFFICLTSISHFYSVTVGRAPGYRYEVMIRRSSNILAFSFPAFPADGTHFHIPPALSDRCLWWSRQVFVSPARPPPRFRPVQEKPQPFYRRPTPRFAPPTPPFIPPSQQKRPCIKQHAVKKKKSQTCDKQHAFQYSPRYLYMIYK